MSFVNINDAVWVFPKIGVPQDGWFIMEKPIKMDDLGVPLFFGNTCMKTTIFHTIFSNPGEKNSQQLCTVTSQNRNPLEQRTPDETDKTFPSLSKS